MGVRARRVGSVVGWCSVACSLAVAPVDAMSLAGTAAADPVEDEVLASDFSPDEFKELFDEAHLSGLAPLAAPPPITGNAELDERIRTVTETRGYRRRPEPSGPLAVADGQRLQPPAAATWTDLKEAAALAGHTLVLRSGYRSPADQASIFNTKLSDVSDAGIDQRLSTSAAPGYSRHHTGYAADITQAGHSVFTFDSTSGYAWLSGDNFANAKRFGWIPSYPDGAVHQGPDPEPWELVWVGRTTIVCGDFRPLDGRTFCDTAGRVQLPDIEWLSTEGITTGCRIDRFCIDDPISRAEVVTMLWRHGCRPSSTVSSPFVDLVSGRYYEPAVRWAWANGVTTGIDANHFGPDRDTTRAEAVTFLWRVVDEPEVPSTSPFVDVERDSFHAAAVDWAHRVGVVRGTAPTTFEPDRPLTRGEAASVIHRLDETGLVDRTACGGSP